MQRIPVDPNQSNPAAVTKAVEILRTGGLVALPTETVYGLGGLADDPAAVARIYAAKGRPASNPLISHVADVAAARALAAPDAWTAHCEALARLWPGPVTLVVRRSNRVSAASCAGRDTVAIRVPDHPVTLAVLRALAGRPVAAPSANPSERLSPVAGEHVIGGLGEAVDLVLDDPQACRLGIESTVIDCTVTPPRVLRMGSADPEVLQQVCPDLDWHAQGADRAAAPGHMTRHYAPRLPMHVLPLTELIALAKEHPAGLAVVHRSTLPDLGGLAERIPLPDDPLRFGGRLYATLHALEATAATWIAVEAVPDGRAWSAVADRLTRGSVPLDGDPGAG